MTTVQDFLSNNEITGALTPEQAAQLLELPQGDTVTTTEQADPPVSAPAPEPSPAVAETNTTTKTDVAEDLSADNAVILAKDGKHIIYTAADHSDPLARPNYDLFWMSLKDKQPVRLTFALGQDVLPVFSPDYKKVMWTTSRDGRSPTQLWIADFTPPKE